MIHSPRILLNQFMVLVALGLLQSVPSSLFTARDAIAQSSSSWTYCATEGGFCSFSGSKQVRYGYNGTYASGTFTGGVACNNSVFGDPLYGVGKDCYYADSGTQSTSNISTTSTPTTPQTTTPTNSTNSTSWTYCATEGGFCSFSGSKQVRYGYNGTYASGTFTGGVACNNSVFGDPLYGVGKDCYYADSGTQSTSNISTTSTPTTPQTTSNMTTATINTTGPTASGKKYYVATYGNNSNSCSAATNISTPKRTIAGPTGGISCLANAQGDWLEIRAGTYSENISTSLQPIASGTSWSNATVIKGYDNETVTLAPTNGGTAIGLEKAQYIIIADLVIDGSQSPNTGDAAIWFGTTDLGAYPPSHHLRFQNIEVKNWYGVNMQASGDFSEILDSVFRDNRAYNGYALYVTGHDNIFEGNEIYNHGGYGVHNYCNGCPNNENPNRNIYRYNEIYNTGHDLVRSPSAVLLQSGDRVEAYGNIVRDNAYTGIGVNGTNTVVYNNTIVGNRYGIGYGFGSNSIIKNNIVYNNSTDWWDFSLGTGYSPVRSANLCTNPGIGCSVSGNPLFQDPSAKNYRLRSGSPAIDRGESLSGVPSYDLDGISRPQGSNWDIGAYEYK